MFQVGIFWVEIFQGGGGNFPGGSLMGGNFPDGNFLGGNFPGTHRGNRSQIFFKTSDLK